MGSVRPMIIFAILCMFLPWGSCVRNPQSDEAYATLLYGDEFLLGVRVLGKSIRDTGTDKDMIVLVSDGVTDYAKQLLEADGWIVEPISLLANPNSQRPKRFWGVYTKLKIFNLTQYKKVVYLDADTIVLRSIEDLFKCGKFCANLKHSERLNSGVLVVEPSETLFNDMMSKVNTLPSYTGGDQGFLNSYYAGFAHAHIFEPNASSSEMPKPEMQRLSTLYNADVGLYMLANKWMVDEKELKIIHYTLGPLKPWDWWTAWLLQPVDVWQEVRTGLKESLPGTGGGRHPTELLIVKILFFLPFIGLCLWYYRSCVQVRKETDTFCTNCLINFTRHTFFKYASGSGYSAIGLSAPSAIASGQQRFSNCSNLKLPSFLGSVAVFICFGICFLSLGFTFLLVPRQVMPWTGLLLLYEWTFTLFFIMFGSFLHFIYELGKETCGGAFSAPSEISSYNSIKGNLRQPASCDTATLFYWLGMATLAIVGPSLPCFFGITSLFLRLGLMVGGGMALVAFMTCASEHMAIIAFVRGRDTIGRFERA